MKPAFTKVNEYIFDPNAWSWSLPSGTTCPGALLCLATADRYTGKITDGPEQEFKCYSAVTERFPSVRKRLWANFDAMRRADPARVAGILQYCLPRGARRVRVHTAGDFFNQRYFDGWILFARRNPHVHFWAFTKSLPYWIKRLDRIPRNFILQASYGGRHDQLIEEHGLKYAQVVYSEEEAEGLGLKLDTNDRRAAFGSEPFALLENFSKGRENA